MWVKGRWRGAAWWRRREKWLDRFAFPPDLLLESVAVWEGKGSTWLDRCIPISFYWQPDKQGSKPCGFQRGCRAPCCVAQYQSFLMAVPPNNSPQKSGESVDWPVYLRCPGLFLRDAQPSCCPFTQRPVQIDTNIRGCERGLWAFRLPQ